MINKSRENLIIFDKKLIYNEFDQYGLYLELTCIGLNDNRGILEQLKENNQQSSAEAKTIATVSEISKEKEYDFYVADTFIPTNTPLLSIKKHSIENMKTRLVDQFREFHIFIHASEAELIIDICNLEFETKSLNEIYSDLIERIDIPYVKDIVYKITWKIPNIDAMQKPLITDGLCGKEDFLGASLYNSGLRWKKSITPPYNQFI